MKAILKPKATMRNKEKKQTVRKGREK